MITHIDTVYDASNAAELKRAEIVAAAILELIFYAEKETVEKNIVLRDIRSCVMRLYNAVMEDVEGAFTYEGLTGVAAQGKAFLVNPEDNDEDIFIEFVVSENEDVLYSSELVPSGQGLDVDFSEFLSAGDHEVVVTMNPYVLYEGEYLRCPVNNAQSVKVKL